MIVVPFSVSEGQVGRSLIRGLVGLGGVDALERIALHEDEPHDAQHAVQEGEEDQRHQHLSCGDVRGDADFRQHVDRPEVRTHGQGIQVRYDNPRLTTHLGEDPAEGSGRERQGEVDQGEDAQPLVGRGAPAAVKDSFCSYLLAAISGKSLANRSINVLKSLLWA